MKQTGMLVVSLRGVIFGFWSHLGCSGQSADIKPPRFPLGFREETQNYAKRHTEVNFLFNFVCHVFISLKLIACSICVFLKKLSGLF